jgi:hypothetical protein
VNSKTILVISGSLFKEDNFIGAMIGSLAKKHNVDVRKVQRDANLTNAYDERFIIGVWFGLESTDYKNRRRDKVSYELGRTCSWSLRIRDEFRSNPRLGDKALIKDNYFFGNNPGEVTTQGQPVPFILKSKLMASIDKSETANAVYGFICYISNLVRLDNVPDEIYWKTIANSVKPFDQMVSKHYNAVYSRKKGKTVLVGYRRPNLPKSSRLLTQGEMNLLINFIKPVFTQLDKIQKDYIELIYEIGYQAVEDMVTDNITLRWQILQKFGKVTKLRLQTIRKLVPGASAKKKADVVPDDVSVLLQRRTSPYMKYAEEVLSLIPSNLQVSLGIRAFKKDFKSIQELKAFLAGEIARIYKESKQFTEEPTELLELEESLPVEINIDQSLAMIDNLERKVASLEFNVKDYATKGENIRVKRSSQIYSLLQKIPHLLQECRKLPIEIINKVLQSYTNDPFVTLSSKLSSLEGRVREVKRVLYQEVLAIPEEQRSKNDDLVFGLVNEERF